MEPIWKRTWVTAVAIAVRGAEFGAAERRCWALARRLWAVMTVHGDAVSDAEEDWDQGYWTDICGFCSVKQFQTVWWVYESDFEGVDAKTITKKLRRVMVEVAARVWRERISILTRSGRQASRPR